MTVSRDCFDGLCGRTDCVECNPCLCGESVDFCCCSDDDDAIVEGQP